MANIVLDFSGIYKRQDFYDNDRLKYLDCTDIKGTDGYCDDGAIELIRSRLMAHCAADAASCGTPAHGIHFIDSGNYHYMSRIFLDWLEEDCVLVVFDNHPDMQPPAFGDILSCGGWLYEAMLDNPHIVKTYVVGVDAHLMEALPEQAAAFRNEGRLIILPKGDSEDHDLYHLAINGEKIYISIDKDVLSKTYVNTNWDQGNMSLEKLVSILEGLLACNKVVGVDVCGEPSPVAVEGDVAASALINKELCEILIKNPY